jgi:S1-C subfamily serine protease
MSAVRSIPVVFPVAILASAVAVAAAACASAGPVSSVASPAASATRTADAGTAAGLQRAYVDVIRRVLPSVVEIRTASGLGSGVVFDSAGDVVTNAHVVAGGRSFRVFLAGSVKPLAATLRGSYPPDDLAVITVTNPPHLTPARFADSSKLQVGQIVLAMGNPLGLASSATDGIISATGRTVSEPPENGSAGATLPDAIQTSAPINPGNSGGALADLSGQVVGIPTLAAADPQLGGAAAGIGFAIPSDIVTSIAGQIIKTGHVTNSHRAALGISAETTAGPDGQPAGVGVVAATASGPAAKAGMRPGDVITTVNRQPTPDTAALAAVLAGLRPGQRVPVTVLTPDGTKRTINVILGQLPGS